ncbi:MAG TPA: RNA 2',3'-cyclic phosphodiesterase [Paracoccaceae bacterium]
MIRALVALDLPEAVRGSLSVLQFLLPLPHRVLEENLHLTLAFLGEQPDAVLEAAHERLVALHLPEFELQLQGVGLFGGPRPRLAFAGVAPCEPLMRLQAKVETAARLAGVPLAARRFVPHVTLGRIARLALPEVMALERAVVALADFQAGPFPVRGFGLYASYPGRKGARYEELARYGLGQ